MATGEPDLFTIYNENTHMSSIYAKRASKELKEVSSQVSAHLESLRRWIKSMPHLNCPTDDLFLLAFLRQSKYNHLKAQHRLDNFCTFRTSETEGCPEWFRPFTTLRDKWEAFIDMKCWTTLGYTKDKTLTAMFRMADWNESGISMIDLQICMQHFNDLCIIDPRVQIGGLCFIMDLQNVRKGQIANMFDPKMSKFGTKYFQECLPFRVKKLIYVNMPKFVEGIFKITSQWLHEKIKSRIMLVHTDMTSVFDEVPGLIDLIPESYGGNNSLTFSEMCERDASTMKSLIEKAPNFEIAVDESKRPAECRSLMREYKDLSNEIMGKAGTYVKLNQDEI